MKRALVMIAIGLVLGDLVGLHARVWRLETRAEREEERVHGSLELVDRVLQDSLGERATHRTCPVDDPDVRRVMEAVRSGTARYEIDSTGGVTIVTSR